MENIKSPLAPTRFTPGPESPEKRKIPRGEGPKTGLGSTEHPRPVFQAVSIFRVRASFAWARGRSWGGDPKGKAYTMGVLGLVYLTLQRGW